jgi:predicted Rossmann fold flavoprotein
MDFDIVVIGGGAAGFFAALSVKNSHSDLRVVILEKSAVLLSKVRISGGGRCNVTHACFDPIALSKNYPRGEKELIGPFHRFQPKDTVQWFSSRGVELKVEKDGRMFPITNSSETIIDCLKAEAKDLGVDILFRQPIEGIEKTDHGFKINRREMVPIFAKKIILATGSSKEGYFWAEKLGHTIAPAVPSLFTFNVPTSPLHELSGISFEKVKISIPGSSFFQTGPLLITHFGFSGPAALKLSAWAARYLFEKNYVVDLQINWIPDRSSQDLYKELEGLKNQSPHRTLVAENPFGFPKSFWKLFLGSLEEKRLNDISLKDLATLAQKLHSDIYQVNGKTTNKEEFVTCGGVVLKEVNFKTMESKICQGLFFAGEILDIDGVTGGFNFQNAWTTGFIAGTSV